MKRRKLRRLLSRLRERGEDVLAFVIHPLETISELEDKRKKDRRNGL